MLLEEPILIVVSLEGWYIPHGEVATSMQQVRM